MALAPRDLLALTPEDQEAANKLEAGIDEKLTAHHEPGSESRFNLTLIASTSNVKMSYKIKKEIESRYEKVGWTVTFEQSGANDFIKLVEAPKEPLRKPSPSSNAVIAPEAPPVGAPGFPTDEQMMAEVLGHPVEDRGPRIVKDPGTPRPPVIIPMTRDDPENPYSRSRLSSR